MSGLTSARTAKRAAFTATSALSTAPAGNDIRVYVHGLQGRNGEIVERAIVVDQLHGDHPINAAQAVQLARALMASADELDG
jgi:hypothetical protein